MGRLTVLSVAYPFARVAADAVGGAEQILSAIDTALVREGQRSIVIAANGSQVAGELVGVPAPAALITPQLRSRVHRQVRAAIRHVLSAERVHVVHLHGIDFPEYLPPPGPAVLATIHLPPSWYSRAGLRPSRPATFLHGVSRTQAAELRDLASPGIVLPTVPNGVALAELGRGTHARRRFALMLGRICPEKGQHLAIEACRRARVPLVIAGEVFGYPEHLAYHKNEVAPNLAAGACRFIGPVGGARKRRLLSAARCVLIPSTAPETSSLVAMEAAACGTPVIAFRSGALPEIVQHETTGFLVDDVDGMARAIAAADAIRPEACVELAQARFDARRMTAAYLGYYRQLAALALPG